MQHVKPDIRTLLAKPTSLVPSLGATAAAPLGAKAISAEDDLAALCRRPRGPSP